MFAYGNPNLHCIEIDKGFTPDLNWEKDDHIKYSAKCSK